MPQSEYEQLQAADSAPSLKLKVRKIKQFQLIKSLDPRFGGPGSISSPLCYTARLYSSRGKEENNSLFPSPWNLIFILQHFNPGYFEVVACISQKSPFGEKSGCIIEETNEELMTLHYFAPCLLPWQCHVQVAGNLKHRGNLILLSLFANVWKVSCTDLLGYGSDRSWI